MANKGQIEQPCKKGCGRKLKPAGRAYHEKFCTGPGYEPGHTYSAPGRHDKKAFKKRLEKAKVKVAKAIKAQVSDGRKDLVPCRKGCGRDLKAAGRPHHERFCTGKGYVPGYSAERRIERRMTTQSPPLKAKEPAYTAYYAPITAVKWAYEMFPEDSALFSAVCHIAACKTENDAEEQIKHLTQARDMLSLKIEMLMGDGER